MESPPYIGVDVNFSTEANKGKRNYMEDIIEVDLDKDSRCGFFAVFDGHGGAEAAKYAAKHLWENIKQQKGFASSDPNRMKKAIREGFVSTHWDMWRAVETWPKRGSGHLSTSGTTATVAIIKEKLLYVAHVGDSAAVLGFSEETESDNLKSNLLTRDHKPDSPDERKRIRNLGGKVAVKKGIARVVWKRPQSTTAGPRRRSSHYEEVPFLAVSRSLGDLWSYDAEREEFLVSPEPEISCHELSPGKDRALVLGSDGLFGVMSGAEVIRFISNHTEELKKEDSKLSTLLVDKALKMWKEKKMRADNVSTIIITFTPVETERPPTPDPTLSRSTSKTSTIASDTEEERDCDESPPISAVNSTITDLSKSGLVRTMSFCCRDLNSNRDSRTLQPFSIENQKFIDSVISRRKKAETELNEEDSSSPIVVECTYESGSDDEQDVTNTISHSSRSTKDTSKCLGDRDVFISKDAEPTLNGTTTPLELTRKLSAAENNDFVHEIEIHVAEDVYDSRRKRKSSENMTENEMATCKRPKSYCGTAFEKSCSFVTSVSPESVQQLEFGGDHSLVDIIASSPRGIPVTPPQRRCVLSDI